MNVVLDLDAVARDYEAASKGLARRVIICAGTGCVANGALLVHAAFRRELEAAGVDVKVELKEEASKDEASEGLHLSRSGCQGFCQKGPLVTLEPEGLLYTNVKVPDVAEIVEKTIRGGEPVERLLYRAGPKTPRCRGTGDIPFYTRQSRFVLAQCGRIDPDDIREYIHLGGYRAAFQAFTAMTPEQICETITDSGLRGRGGGGFPTGRKWELARRREADKKYVICNGDEGDPGAFMDRSVMEGNPHSVIEGLLIAGRAIGADHAFVYVRAEYPLAVERLRYAVSEAERMGILGAQAFGVGGPFVVEVMEGAGAFVCGEETALMASIEGSRGMPLPKPPFPAESGLWGKPTVINNVETLASVPLILDGGGAGYKRRGTPGSPGTKTFALTGHVANTGLIEVPFGTTLREIVYEIGGGVTDARGKPTDAPFKSVQIGGPSGGCLTAEHLDLPLDFDSLKDVDAMVGSGGLVVMNQDTCMVSVARYFMEFTRNESCGKCVLCREGTRQMLALLDDVTEGRADARTLELLEQLAGGVRKGSLCGLGKTAPNPVLSTMRRFREEYEAHVFEKRCPAGECKALTPPQILADRCKGCMRCIKACPTGAIRGEKKQVHVLDENLCARCGECAKVCKFDAIIGVN